MTPLPDALSLEISEDRLLATLSIAPGAVGTGRDVEAVRAYLHEYSVRVNADVQTAIEVLVDAFAADPARGHRMMIACGVAARHGQDGRIEWAEGLDPADPRDASGEPVAFARVGLGDRVGTLVPASEGIDGRDVCGVTIPARHGAPLAFGHDESVRVEGDGELIAATPGMIFFENGLLRVSTHLRIEGDVAAANEDLIFDGDITVDGGVRDNCAVEATGTVIVKGLVGAAHITAGVDASFEGGVAGRRRAVLSAERDLRARYLDSFVGVVGRHVFVDREIVDARLEAGGRLHCPNGALRGGECSAGGVCEFAEFGSPAGTPTRLTLGALHDFGELRPRLGAMEEAVSAAEANARREYESLRTYASMLTETQADQMTVLEHSLATCQRLRGRLEEADSRIGRVSDRFTDIELTVQRVIHRGVVLVIGDVEWEFADPLGGPVRISIGAGGEPLVTNLTTDETTTLRDHARTRSLESTAIAA